MEYVTEKPKAHWNRGICLVKVKLTIKKEGHS